MPSYKAPLDDIRFVLHEVLDVCQLSKLPGFESVDADTVNTMLGMVAQFSEDVLTPLNAVGDRQGCTLNRDAATVRTPDGFKEAYDQFCANGLTTTTCDPAYGGMGMPVTLNTAMGEMLCSANVAFAMYPGLSHGAYNAIHEYGTEELKKAYLPKIVTGEWSGTMCLTEPQCGTDLGLIKTKAVRAADGSFAVTGTKIFISAGEHEMASNIVHLVLARIDDPATPPGIKGISLFCVPKFIDGARNPVFCRRLEEKMGIHGNSTCEMSFEGARGWLVGEAHKGMKAMFVMMNEARLGVGLQGLGLSEVAYQNGLAYALDRVQSAEITAKQGKDGAAAPSARIIRHPDVRRMLMTIRSQAEGARALAYWTALQLDIAQKHPDAKIKSHAQKLVDIMTPIVKAHMTDNAETNTSDAIQIFGGHGYIREHGIEQFYRDARITRLYEGTNGIQALDLLGRKILGAREALLPAYLAQVAADIRAARRAGLPRRYVSALTCAVWQLRRATLSLKLKAICAKALGRDMSGVMQTAGAMATDYLKLMSLVAMGHMWVKMAGVAWARRAQGGAHAAFYDAKLATARFYMDKMMPQRHAHAAAMKTGPEPVMALPDDGFAHLETNVAAKTAA